MQLSYNNSGLEAIIFTADGDMRQALNNLQSTHAGFGDILADNVFKVRQADCLFYLLCVAVMVLVGQWA